ncbi:Dabb family protein [Aureliella helgolandensis]|uniref:Stress responsive A/B Barrel Domain protein n=1 Tax=Aureliella helgolandensis TaxID=2527968 RepID=A0A518G7Y0_9BACT|nr:Dabb family protein [Aureliella helgolandensis]QDV24694.1 Stress responsive A/B Barrel Domain protein [Aureliella helgolandensis]
MNSAPRIAHTVYFSLHDSSPANVQALLGECQKYLNNHPGLEFFAVGTPHPDLDRPVNDRAFDVCLNTVFTDLAAHDAYQIEPRHLEFIERNKPSWKQVRVFDSNLEA